MISVKVDQLFLSNMGFVVLLKGGSDERSLPIFIGAAEAQAIASQLSGAEQPPRPMTHDLMKNLLDFLECRLMKIVVCDLKEGTFHAQLVLDRDGRVMEMDSRPSDAIALALRCSSPIYIANEVMEEAGRVFEATETEGSVKEVEGSKQKPGRKLTALEVLEQELEAAVNEERYEDAAKARDEIKRLKQHSGN